jgi:hypothetical protein
MSPNGYSTLGALGRLNLGLCSKVLRVFIALALDKKRSRQIKAFAPDKTTYSDLSLALRNRK